MKYNFYWMCIAFDHHKIKKNLSWIILIWGPSVHQSDEISFLWLSYIGFNFCLARDFLSCWLWWSNLPCWWGIVAKNSNSPKVMESSPKPYKWAWKWGNPFPGKPTDEIPTLVDTPVAALWETLKQRSPAKPCLGCWPTETMR